MNESCLTHMNESCLTRISPSMSHTHHTATLLSYMNHVTREWLYINVNDSILTWMTLNYMYISHTLSLFSLTRMNESCLTRLTPCTHQKAKFDSFVNTHKTCQVSYDKGDPRKHKDQVSHEWFTFVNTHMTCQVSHDKGDPRKHKDQVSHEWFTFVNTHKTCQVSHDKGDPRKHKDQVSHEWFTFVNTHKTCQLMSHTHKSNVHKQHVMSLPWLTVTCWEMTSCVSR